MALGTNYKRNSRKEDLIVRFGLFRLLTDKNWANGDEIKLMRKMTIKDIEKYIKKEKS